MNIKYQDNGTKYGIPFVKCSPNWKISDNFQYVDELNPYYLGHLNVIDGSYSAWSFDNIIMLDSDTILIFYGNRPAHYVATGNKTFMCRYTISTGAKVNTLTPFNEVAQSIIKNGNTYYAFTADKRYATTDFVTWTESSISVAYPPMYGINFNGRFIAIPNSSAKGRVLYSDDLGLTWTTVNTLNDMYITHGGVTNVNGTAVIYCTSTSPGNAAYIEVEECGDRYVITSQDGINWTSPVRCTGDLEYGGASYVSGAFEHIGDDWYYFTSNRTQIPPISGRMNLFKGSASDVINGTMSLSKTITIAVDPYTGSGSGAYMTDNGNVGMCTDGTNLYCTYNRPLGHAVIDWCSNSMQVLSVMAKYPVTEATDDYYDSSWVTKRDAFIAAKNTSHTWYAYKGLTNITQANMKSGTASTDYSGGSTTTLINDTFEFDDDIEIPFTNGFRLEIAFNRFNSSGTPNRIGANISGESFSALVLNNQIGVFVPAVTQTNTVGTGIAKLHGRAATDPDYLILEYNKNNSGKLYAYCNGIEIDSIENVCDATDYAWSTQNVVFIESVWSYLNSRSGVNNAEIKAFTIDTW